MKQLSFLMCVAMIFMAGCAGSNSSLSPVINNQPPTSSAPGITVTVSPASTVIQAGTSRQFTATVVNDPSNKGVTWSLPNASCTAITCGTIDASGKLTVPGTVSVPLINLVVQATSVADPTKTGAASYSISLAAAGVSVSPVVANIVGQNAIQFAATVSPGFGAKQEVVWSVSGTGCSGVGCGAINSAGVYTPPVVTPSPPMVTVTATATASPGVSGSASVRLSSSPDPNNGKLNGQYAFLLSGFDGDGYLQAIGTLSADGKGNITSGTEDFSEVLGVAACSFTGAYSVGSDNRGSITLNVSSCSPFGPGFSIANFTVALNHIEAGLAAQGRLSGFYKDEVTTGTLVKRDPASFSDAAIQGNYAFGFAGMGSEGSYLSAAVGRFTADHGSLVSGEADVIDGIAPATHRLFTGGYTLDANGRGLATMPIGSTSYFVFYVTSANQLLFMELDSRGNSSSPAISGVALRQSGGPFSSKSLNGASVLNLSGNGSGVVGQETFDGNGGLSAVIDENNSATASHSSLTGTYSVDSDGLGRGSVIMGGKVSPLYLVSPGKGFILDNSFRSGFFEPQTTTAFNNSLFSGEYSQGTLLLPLDFAGLPRSGILIPDGAGKLRGTADGATSNQNFGGTYSIGKNGRASLTLTPDGESANMVFYFASEFKSVGIRIDPGTDPQILVIEK